MRKFNIVIGLLAFTLAIGSAFVTTHSNTKTVKVSVLLLGNESFLCINTGFQCNETGAQICQVEVSTLAGMVTVGGKNDLLCVTTLANDAYSPVGLFDPISGLILEA